MADDQNVKLLPIDVVNTIRQHMDTVVDIYGFPCELYIPKQGHIEQREQLDVYNERPDLGDAGFEEVILTKVFIEWAPDIKKLRRLGIFTEGDLPIVGWFKYSEADYNLQRNSYIKININYIPDQWKTDEFELIDCLIRNMYNAVAIQAWRLAPRRK